MIAPGSRTVRARTTAAALIGFATLWIAPPARAAELPTWEEAGAHYEKGDWQRAADAYAAIAKREPGSARAWNRLGYAQAKLRKYPQAIEAYGKAEAIGHHPSVMYNLACAHAQMADTAQAFAWLERAAANNFRQVESLRSDVELEGLRASDHYAALVARVERNARPCAHLEEHRRLDFWLGEWEVRSPEGTRVGHNSITLADGDCVVHEHWTDAQGGVGQSFNFYNPTTRTWHQSWVDDQGEVAEFDGDFRDGAMRLEGYRQGPDGTRIPARLTLTPRADGSVRQLGENSTDQGKVWTVLYDLTYTKAK